MPSASRISAKPSSGSGGIGRALEAILHGVEHRRQPGEQAAEVGLAAQLSLRSRVASVRSRSALSRMKPAASRWS